MALQVQNKILGIVEPPLKDHLAPGSLSILKKREHKRHANGKSSSSVGNFKGISRLSSGFPTEPCVVVQSKVGRSPSAGN